MAYEYRIKDQHAVYFITQLYEGYFLCSGETRVLPAESDTNNCR